MKVIVQLSLMVLFAIFIITSCKKDDKSSENEDVVPPYKKCHLSEIVYSYIDKNRDIIPFESTEFSYAGNNILSEIRYYDIDENGNKDLFTSEKYYYGQDNKLEKVEFYNSDGEIRGFQTSNYDESGKCTGYDIYDIDEQGNPVLDDLFEIEYDAQGHVSHAGTFFYGFDVVCDQNGNVLKETFKYNGNEIYENNYQDYDNRYNPWKSLNLTYSPEMAYINTNNFRRYSIVDLDPNDPYSVGDSFNYTYEYNSNGYPVRAFSADDYVKDYIYLGCE